MKQIELYKSNQLYSDVMDKSKKQLLLLVYEKIIENLDLIAVKINERKIKDKLELVKKTLEIIQMGLIDCLRKGQDEKLYNSLMVFYEISMISIVKANGKNDINEIIQTRNNFINVKECWEKILKD